MKNYFNPDPDTWATILERPVKSIDNLDGIVSEVFSAVQKEGDQALQDYTQRFDQVQVSDLLVSDEEFEQAENLVPQELKEAIQTAKGNIEKFHRAQITERITVETQQGVNCWQEKRPIEKVGLYIPGGTAPLFSSVLMLAVPAVIAGCDTIAICTPPGKDGKIHPAVLYTARLCGVTNVYKVGGIQAIAALTFGTTSIPKVYKILGPGNQYVTFAKQLATQYGVAIDMPAGPSELLVYADSTARAPFVAADLLSQAEHGADSQVILVTTSQGLMEEVSSELQKQLKKLPRKEIAQKAIDHSVMILMKDESSALRLINEYGPEHFILISGNEEYFLNGIVNAGSVFIGNYTPESAGDYASGTNHTLPTNGYAKQYSGVNLDSFTKSLTFQKIDQKGLEELGPVIEVMADAEGLQAHKNAVSIRLKHLKE